VREQKLDVIVKAIALIKHTLQITSNTKRYPKKYTVLIQRIQNACMDVFENLTESNRQNLETQWRLSQQGNGRPVES